MSTVYCMFFVFSHVLFVLFRMVSVIWTKKI